MILIEGTLRLTSLRTFRIKTAHNVKQKQQAFEENASKSLISNNDSFCETAENMLSFILIATA